MSKGDIRRLILTLSTFAALFLGGAASSTNWRF
jgi:hypothetical protein